MGRGLLDLQPDDRAARELSSLTSSRGARRGPIMLLRKIWGKVIKGRSPHHEPLPQHEPLPHHEPSPHHKLSPHNESLHACSSPSPSEQSSHEGVTLSNENKSISISSEFITKLEPYPHGSGGLGDVWKCSMSTNSTPIETHLVAVKSIRLHSVDYEVLLKTAKRIRREAYVWVHLSHSHILPFKGLTEGFGPLPALVSAWMENGSLSDYLKWKYFELSDTRKSELIQHVAAGLSYLHGLDIVHGDLTGANILVDGPGNLYLADFSLSMIIAKEENVSFGSVCPGNSRWMAPEFVILGFDDGEGEVLDEKPTKVGDVYSFGCVMLQILSGKEPYARMRSAVRVITAIMGGLQPFDGVEINMSEAYKLLSSRCLSREPDSRPTMVEIINVVGPTV